nr:MAG TPA: hypothetical protein [Caudoviricetes sp.]
MLLSSCWFRSQRALESSPQLAPNALYLRSNYG